MRVTYFCTIFISILNIQLLLSQELEPDSAYYYFHKSTSIEDLESKIGRMANKTDIAFYKLIYFSKLRETDSILSRIKWLEKLHNISPTRKAKLAYFKGFYYKIIDNDSLYFKNSYKAYQEAQSAKDTLTVLYSLSALSQTYNYDDDNSYNLQYLNILEQKAKEYNNNYFKVIHRYLLANYYLFREENQQSATNYQKLLSYDFSKKDSIFLLYTYNSLGVLYEENFNVPDSAIFYFKKKLEFIKQKPEYGTSNTYFNTYLNIANAHFSKKEFTPSEHYYLLADSITSDENDLFNKSIVKENLAQLYFETKTYDKAYTNLTQYIVFSDSLKKEDQREAIARIKEQFDNEKLRADNLESEAKRKTNKNLLFAALALLLFGGLTAFLLQKNTKRKQLLAEQEKALESQKLATVLKEQELVTIDAMIEGQEKERQRIANDLHDDLGSLMTTVKWQFDAFKQHQSAEFFDKTNDLLEEAYQKIRSIAHAKNSGVIAKQGLLKAVQQMAEKVSHSNKITIDVVDHGLDERLENSLELTIFRVIQELITNIVKHSEANEATIHITNHKDSLNIMVEDNGKGFNPKQVTKTNQGMGISSIDKRIAHLNGFMTIESEPKKGTTIIIDIPI